MGLMLIAFASISFAQALQFKVGDEIEAFSYGSASGATHWGKATIIGISAARQASPYEVHFTGQPAGWNDFVGQIRPLAGAAATFKVNQIVDTFYAEKKGKGRGSIIETGDGKYKIHYIGCKAYWDEWVDRSLVSPAATMSVDAPEVKFLVGKWSMTTVGISSTAIAWGKSNDIQINGDGTYIWNQSGGKPPIRGKWITDPKVEGADTGTQKMDGVLIKDALGQEWKVYRRVSTSDRLDHITAHQMCQGITDIGTRAR